MEIRQLLYFTRIVSLGSFSKAANELRIAQPSLGQQVRNLEEELGTKLLVRHSRGVKPTAPGVILFQHASKILQDVRRAKEGVLAIANQPKGIVNVGMTRGSAIYSRRSLLSLASGIAPTFASTSSRI